MDSLGASESYSFKMERSPKFEEEVPEISQSSNESSSVSMSSDELVSYGTPVR